MNEAKTKTVYLLAKDEVPRLLMSELKIHRINLVTHESVEELLKSAEKADLPACILVFSRGDRENALKENKELVRKIKERSHLPVVFAIPNAPEQTIVELLAAGADDVLRSPFGARELAHRLLALLRRLQMPPLPARSVLVVDENLSIDFDRRLVYVNGESVTLRPTEWRLLYHLVQNAGRIVSSRELLTKVWGSEYQDADNFVRLYINYLRKKLKDDPKQPRYIATVHGHGYSFLSPERLGRQRSQSMVLS